jgi:hypothetical protein
MGATSVAGFFGSPAGDQKYEMLCDKLQVNKHVRHANVNYSAAFSTLDLSPWEALKAPIWPLTAC